MRKAWAFAALVVCGISPAVWADAAADAKAISARGQEFVAAWNRDDAKGMAALWAPDGDLINPFGRVARGRAEVEKLFADEHSAMMKGTTFKVESEAVRLLGPSAAVMDWDADVIGMTGPDGKAMPPFKNHVTIVLMKQGDTWWVAAARPISYPPPPGAGK
jgi:uncharacterized protein (TIGR02246 family)